MKSTGIIRGLDNMGRVVIPKEIRKFLDMTEGVDEFEIYMQDDCIVLKKHKPTCIFCNAENDCIEFEGQIVCKSCIEKLQLKNIENKINE
ncbi:MAG: AbrB family transcriptional regulator [Clostridia bacterium]|nr:AbrB family transcriptional regulator [Clostridia bacterium]